MKDFAKSIVCNTKAGNSRVGNELTSYEKAKKSDLEKRLKKEEQLLEDAKKMLRSKLSDDDRIGFQMQKEECEKNVSRLKEEIRKIGNSKVGNANTHLTASNSGELWLNFDGTGEMYDPIELGRYDFSGKSEALSVARELEQLKRKAEQKVKDADKFINAIKQWAAGLK